MTTILSSRRLLALLACCLLGAAVLLYAVVGGGYGDRADASAGRGEETTVTDEAQAMIAIDPRDERRLVGASTDVFFGRVTEQSGSKGNPTSKTGVEKPQTQFSVEVEEAIKGDASGTVTVNQEAGFAEDDGHKDNNKHLEIVKGDQLLEPGQEYLFFTIYSKRNGWYNLTAPAEQAHVPIGSRADRAKEKREAQEAKENQIEMDRSNPPPPADPNAGRPCLDESKSKPPNCNPSAPVPPKKETTGTPEKLKEGRPPE